MPTNTPKSLLAAALLLAPVLAPAQTLSFVNTKAWRQVGLEELLYLGGETNMFFVDGFWDLSGCAHPSLAIVGPDPLFCPLGTTGFIAQGDIDGDGLNDQGSFWSVQSITPASLIEPFRSDLFRLVSAPPSGFTQILRGTDGDVSAIFDVQDFSVLVWYNVLGGIVDDYEVTQYQALRSYGPGKQELERHYFDVPWGPYKFSLPGLLPDSSPQEPQPIVFPVDHLVTPDAYPGRGMVPQGWRNINEEWGQKGSLEFDPRTFYDFKWGGLSADNTLETDVLFFSMRGNQFINTDGVEATAYAQDTTIRGTVTGLACETLTTNVDLDSVLEQGKIYELNFTSGSMAGTEEAIQYPITVFGTGGGLDLNELLIPVDFSGGIVTGRIQGVAGTLLTTNRNLDLCLVPGQSYRLEITSGALAGTEEFPITGWGAPGFTDLTALSALAVAPGDTFTLTPENVDATFTVDFVGRHFLEASDALGSPADFSTLVRGGEYRLEIFTGGLAGTSVSIRNWGFPTNAYLETETDLFGSLQPGDTFGIDLIELPGISIKVGDSFTIGQIFEDWIQDKYDAGEVLAVPALILEASPLFGGFGIPAIPELLVDPGGLLSPPLFAVAREDTIVFPPYPIETPPGNRNQFILGTLDNHYELGPFFFNPGDSLDTVLNIARSSISSVTTTDAGSYALTFRVEFIDTYEGFALLGGLLDGEGFPFATPSSERAPDYDFDRDGATNLLEYALQTDVADPLDRPAFQYALDEAAGSCTATLTKRPFTGTSLEYFFEYSTDLQNWTTISENDPVFEIVQDDEDTLEVANFAAFVTSDPVQFPSPACFLRVRVEVQ
ncbi:MAG: hypothetical protein MK194_02625 [Roseibacillus sp.]|nr:hypothetical protein [Roseibacillus sp.]